MKFTRFSGFSTSEKSIFVPLISVRCFHSKHMLPLQEGKEEKGSSGEKEESKNGKEK